MRCKANQVLGFIRGLTIDQQRYLYFQLVRNNFAYSSQVWSPQTIQLIESMENVQTRTMFHIHRDRFNLTYFPYPIAWNIFLLFKIINTYTCIDDSARPIMTVSGITSSQMNKDVLLIKFSIPFASMGTFQTFYFIKACKTCDILGCNVRHKDIGIYTVHSNQNLRHITNTRYPMSAIVTIRVHMC